MLDYQTLSDSAVEMLRKMILNGTYKPGERINQVQLAEKLQISRGPLREALRMLQNEGLIRHETNRGTFVSTLSEDDAWEIYTLRALLEGEAAQLAMLRLTPQDYEQLENLLTDFHQAYMDHDLEQMAGCDIRFHKKIVEASGHYRLRQMHQQLDIQVGAMFVTMANKVPIRVNHVVSNHRILLEALQAKNTAKIKKVFADHYLVALDELIKS
jgi:DNA-binding GntR family transcriptional regulator